jgi:polyisoprenoid-binding protein YceI
MSPIWCRIEFMKKIIILLAAVLVIGVAGFIFYIAQDSPDETSVENISNEGQKTIDVKDLNGTWVNNPSNASSLIGYRVNETFASDKVKKTAVGRTSNFDAEVTIRDNKLQSATVEVLVKNLKSDSDRRDSAVNDRALEVSQFPNATLRIIEPDVDLADVKQGEKFTKPLKGTLTLHGVTKDVSFEAEGNWGNTGINLAGSIQINLSEYDIEPPSVSGFVNVEDQGELEFQINFIPKETK